MQIVNYLVSPIFSTFQRVGQATGISRDTVRKATALGFCFLLLVGIPVPAMGATCENGICESGPLPKYVEPYQNALSGRVTPDAEGVIERFPDWLYRFPETGVLSNLEGNRACRIEESIPKFKSCDVFSEMVETHVARAQPEEYQRLINDPRGGFAEVADDMGYGIVRANFGNDPQKLKNQQAFLAYLEQTVLQNPDFFQLSVEEILSVIQEAHKILFKDLAYGGSAPGKFREQAVHVTRQKNNTTFEELEDILRENGGTKADFQKFKKSLEKMKQYGSFEAAYPHFTKAEINVWKKMGHLPPMPEKIEGEMHKFAKELKKLGPKVRNHEISGMAAGAWVHTELGRIHPFADGNGRLARGFCNALQQLGGFEATIFQSDDAYSKAVAQDQKKAGHFAGYLEQSAEWSRRQAALNKKVS